MSAPDITQPLGQLQAVYDAIPADARNDGMGRLLGYVLAAGGPLFNVGHTILSSIEFDDVVNTSRNVENALTSAYDVSRASVLSAVTTAVQSPGSRDRVMAIFDSWHSTHVSGAGPDRSSTMGLIIDVFDEIGNDRRNTASRLMTSSILGSAFVVTMQALQLYLTFQELKKTDSVVKDTQTFDSIDQQLDALGVAVKFMQKCVHQHDWEQAKLTLGRVQRLNAHVNGRVSRLRIKVDGMVTSVGAARDRAFINGCSNAVMAVSSGYQAHVLWFWLSGPYHVLAASMVAAYALLTCGNCVAWSSSERRLAELGAVHAKVDLLVEAMNHYDAEIEAMEKELNNGAFAAQRG